MALEAFSLIGRITLDGAEKVTRGLDNVGKRTRRAGYEMESFGGETFRAMDTAADATDDMGRAIKKMRDEMKAAMREQKKAMQPFRKQQLDVQKGFWDLTKATKNWKGSTQDLLDEINKLGKAEKKATDAMMKMNEVGKMGLLQSIGQVNAMSTQSEKLSQNYDRMGKAIYSVNKPLLAISDGLEKIAKAGQPAAIALKQLGAGANMKDLNDMIKLITAGLMRFQMVALGAAVAFAGFTAAMAKAAHGTAPDEIRAQMAEIENIYDEALEERRQQLYEWAGLFEEIEFKPVDPQKLIDALKGQIQIFDGWAANLKRLAKRGVDEGLLEELRQMTPKAAAEVQALQKMTDAQLTEYVALWNEKHKQVTDQAVSELEFLRQATDQKVQELKNSIMPLALAWEDFQSTWAEALAPFVESWSVVAAKVVDAGTAIGDFFVTLNQNDMSWVITALGWFAYAFTALTLLLSPLAIGVGLVGGFAAAWASAAPIIMPIVSGLAAMSGTVVLVIAGIAALIAIIYLVVKSFKEWINSSEEVRAGVMEKIQAIKDGAAPILEAFKGLWDSAMNMIKRVVGQILGELAVFWSEHGMQIMQAVQNFLGFLSAIFAVVFPIIKFIVMGALNAILNIFHGVFTAIMGIIKIFTGLMTLDFGLMWEGIKQLFFGAIEAVWGYLNLMFIGRILKGIGGFFAALRAKFSGGLTTIRLNVMYFKDKVMAIITNLKNLFIATFTTMRNMGLSIWNSLRAGIQVVLQAISQRVLQISTKIYTTFQSKFNAVLSTTRTIFNNVKTAITKPIEAAKTAVGKAVDWIRTKFNNLKLKLPKIKVPKFRIKNWSINPANWVKNPPAIDITWHKRGAFFDEATVLNGLGERGKEAIIPLENRKYMQPFSQAIAENLAAITGGGAQRIEIPIMLNNREILRAIIPDLDRALKTRQSNYGGLVNRGNL